MSRNLVSLLLYPEKHFRKTRRGACCVTLANLVYIIGGETSDRQVTTSVEVYQNTLFTLHDNSDTDNRAETGQPVLVSPLLLARSEAEAVAEAERRMIFVMGGRADNKTVTNTVQAGHRALYGSIIKFENISQK